MKVYQDEPNYKPVVIVLESREEYNAMWHLVNCYSGISLKEYVAGRMECENLEMFKTKIYQELERNI